MSWFKRGSERRSPESLDQPQSDIDPNTCFEVFQNHWKQAWTVISSLDRKNTAVNGQATADGVEAVLRNLEQMVTLLASENDDGGLPGPILRFVMESELLDKVCSWCSVNVSAHEKLRMQQLRLFELIISQSKQMLLIHKPVIKPLLRLLIDVADSQEISNGELEFKLVLVLHQICICISQQNLILESFFSTDADHGPARFLIFSLLIPYIHREGSVGQKARDALLLIMTLSARHPHIGQYIANNSDFCPVLATGLSGLYSSLPRKITPPTDDWHAITWEDCVNIPDLQMFLNSLQFSNAVVQVAHPLVRKQLIEFIYSGFLVPVLAPALHQISREEVMTATAYLDLFIRHVTEPHLLKAVLKFVLVEKYDDIPVLDTLLSRISSNSHLSTVTLALFHTLIDLNCEDVMFQLVFRYLVPCTHVMVSQRRSVRDLDLYSKSAEKFLSLRPKCCIRDNVPNLVSATAPPHIVGVSSQPLRLSVSSISTIAGPTISMMPSSSEAETDLLWETSYFEYLHDGRNKLEQTMLACCRWSLPYDGENPPPDSIVGAEKVAMTSASKNSAPVKSTESGPETGYIELGSILKLGEDKPEITRSNTSTQKVKFNIKIADVRTENSGVLPQEESNIKGHKIDLDSHLYSSLDNVDVFMTYLNELSLDVDAVQRVQSTEECIADLTDLLKTVPDRTFHRTIIRNEDEDTWNKSANSVIVSSISLVTTNTPLLSFKQSEIPFNDIFQGEPLKSGQISLEETPMSSNVPSVDTVNHHEEQLHSDLSSKSDHSQVPDTDNENTYVDIVQSSTEQDENAHVNIAQSSTELDENAHVNIAQSSTEQDENAHVNIAQSSTEQDENTLNNKNQTEDSSSPTTSQSTTNKERSVPKTLPSVLKISQHSSYALPTSVFSPMKSPGDMLSPFKSVLTPSEEFPVTATASPGLKKLKYLNDAPNIGPFLSAVFARLEGMISNSLYFNLLLTGVLSRLAAYPQPLLRSFLLNHNLVFQPSVKSLIQVLSSLRQKLDNFSVAVKNFDNLVINARQNLAQREGQLFHSLEPSMSGPIPSSLALHYQKPRADTISGIQSLKEKKKVTLSDLIFRRSPGKDKIPGGKGGKKNSHVEMLQVESGAGFNYTTNHISSDTAITNSVQHDGSLHALSTWNAVYCALVLDEFLKELAALSQEHSVLHSDEGYLSS